MNKKSIEELELMSNKDIAYMILENRKRSISTADLFKKIVDLLNLPDRTFEEKIGEFYTTLSTDKRFILLDNGNWDLKGRHSSEKIKKPLTDEDDDELEDEEDELEEIDEDILEDNYDSTDDIDDYVDPNEDIIDLVVLEENELEED